MSVVTDWQPHPDKTFDCPVECRRADGLVYYRVLSERDGLYAEVIADENSPVDSVRAGITEGVRMVKTAERILDEGDRARARRTAQSREAIVRWVVMEGLPRDQAEPAVDELLALAATARGDASRGHSAGRHPRLASRPAAVGGRVVLGDPPLVQLAELMDVLTERVGRAIDLIVAGQAAHGAVTPRR